MDDQRTDREDGESLGASPDCLVAATSDVGVDRKTIRWMLRLRPADGLDFGLGEGQVSGWLLMTGDDNEDSGSTNMYFLRQILDFNPEIASYLTLPAPRRLEREGDSPVFVDVTEEYDFPK
jgi:hypothetical protein